MTISTFSRLAKVQLTLLCAAGLVVPAVGQDSEANVAKTNVSNADQESASPRPQTNLSLANRAMEVEDEIIVRGQRPSIVAPRTMLESYDANSLGGYYYRLRLYEKAYPYLLEAAKMGFKESQARVGFIYQQGLGGVERNWIEAVGWIGVAASRASRPEIRNYYYQMRRKIQGAYPEQMEKIDHIVDVYISKYGSKATGVSCDMNRRAGSHIARMRCTFDDEYKYRDELGLYDPLQVDPIGGGAPGG